jgi:hypothetical protein
VVGNGDSGGNGRPVELLGAKPLLFDLFVEPTEEEVSD